MRPLEADPSSLTLERLLDSAPVERVREAIEAARGSDSPPSAAALRFAEGSLLLRQGSLVEAGVALREAAELFGSSLEERQLSLLGALVSDVRRGVRDLAAQARDEADALSTSGVSARVVCSALIVRGTAERVLGDASSAQRSFLTARSWAGEHTDLKTQALNSLGTLYVVTGALGAARSVLEPSAELCRARGDVLGEAIAMGQLGAASLALGDLPLARRQLSRQEWLARQIGDAFGQARALVWLAEVALELGSMDDAIDIAARARAVAEVAGLGTFAAYADRVAGRATQAAGRDGRAFSERALETFSRQGLPLGQALVAWDLAVPVGRIGGSIGGAIEGTIDEAFADRALTGFASLGLVDRVVDVLRDLGERPALVLMASATSPLRAEAIEADLVHAAPDALACAVEERAASRRNLARLAAWSRGPSGLVAAAIVMDKPGRALNRSSFGGAAAGTLGTVALFVWRDTLDPAMIAADLEHLVDLGGSQLAVAADSEARIEVPGFGGGLGAQLRGLDVPALLNTTLGSSGGGLGDMAFGVGFTPPTPVGEAIAAAIARSKLAGSQTSS